MEGKTENRLPNLIVLRVHAKPLPWESTLTFFLTPSLLLILQGASLPPHKVGVFDQVPFHKNFVKQ